MSKNINFFLAFRCFKLLFLLLLSGCFESSDLIKVQKKGELKIIVRNIPATYFYTKDAKFGFEYEIAKLFADYLKVNLVVEVADNLIEVEEKLNISTSPTIVVAGIIDNEINQHKMQLTNSFLTVNNVIVYHKKYPKPTKLDDLTKAKIKVIKNSHQEYFLNKLQRNIYGLNFVAEPYEVTDLLYELDNGEFDIALINSIEFDLLRFSFTNIKQAFITDDKINLVWATNKQTDNSLVNQANMFFQKIQQDGTLQNIIERYYSHTKTMDYVGINTFTNHLRTRLPLYEKYFRQAGIKYNVDWRLLAAIGYQESKWLVSATSKTGVRGIMMLTNDTAEAMGVTDRLDPKQSIFGGSKYFAQIKQKLPNDILEPNRTWFALAAYNVGLGHVYDARSLARAENLDDKEWDNIRSMLLRLKQQKWHSKTKYGYARGGEAVIFSQNVQRYYDILVWSTFKDDAFVKVN